MPCSDVTEVLEIQLDPEDCLQSFDLHKMTCGKSVGGKELQPYVQGTSIQKIEGSTVADFVPHVDDLSDVDAFILCKHLFSIQEALAVFIGMDAGRTSDCFTIEHIEYEPDGCVSIRGLIRLDVKTEEIKSCRGCKCASRKTA